MRKGKRYTEEQIIKALKDIDAGASSAAVAPANPLYGFRRLHPLLPGRTSRRSLESGNSRD